MSPSLLSSLERGSMTGLEKTAEIEPRGLATFTKTQMFLTQNVNRKSNVLFLGAFYRVSVGKVKVNVKLLKGSRSLHLIAWVT